MLMLPAVALLLLLKLTELSVLAAETAGFMLCA
jgi:hypothetical protein